MKAISLIVIMALCGVFLAACGGSSDPTSTPEPATSADTGSASAGEESLCQVTGSSEDIPDAKLFFEFQSTDNDTGIHGLFDSSGFAELCVYAPDGSQILAVKPQEQLKDLGMGGIFFESREPEANELSQAQIVGEFPEGEYEVVAVGVDGTVLTGAATLTHNIPEPPVVTSTSEGDVVDPDNLVITWEPVTQSVSGNPVTITGYEVIVTNDEVEDPNGMSQPVLSAHVIPSVTSLTIPSEFLEAGVEYELEVIAIEESGNQTITVVFFETP